MSAWLARVIVRGSAWIAPRAMRARWREEWLAEIEAEKDLGGLFTKHVKRPPRSFSRALGAPWDALLLRVLHWSSQSIGSGWRSDVLQTRRLLQREPWHVVAVTLCLGVGVAATVTTFSIINAMLYAEIPGVEDRATLHELYLREIGVNSVYPMASLAQYREFHDAAPSLLDVTATSDIRSRSNRAHLAIRIGDDAVPITGQFVAGNFFDVLGTRPVLGRLLAAADDRPDGQVAVIGHRFWQSRLGGGREILGATVTISGQPIRIIGVAPEGFAGGLLRDPDEGGPPELWLPLATSPSWPPEVARYVTVLVRPHPGVTREVAEAAMAPLVATLPRRSGIDAIVPVLRPVGFSRNGTSAELAFAIALILAAPLTVVAIGCANVANLRLARASARAHELTVRLSLGATRAQIVRLLVIDAAAATCLATGAGWLGARALIEASASVGERVLKTPPVLDVRVFAFAIALTFFVLLLCGLGPAWLTTRRLDCRGLSASSSSIGRTHGRWRSALVTTQIALSLALVAIAALLGRSLQMMAGTAAPFMQELLIARVDPSRIGTSAEGALLLADQIEARLQPDRRVMSVGVADTGLFDNSDGTYRRPGGSDSDMRVARIARVSSDWFRTMNLAVAGGRVFSAGDRHSAVAIVGQALAAKLAPGASPIGMALEIRRSVRNSAPVVCTIIGVVSDAPRAPQQTGASPAIYLPYGGEIVDATNPARPFAVYVRGSEPAQLVPDIRRLVTTLEPRAPWTEFDTGTMIVDDATAPERVVAEAFGGLGIVALVLAATGLYAVMTYVVSLRRREIGIRMAIGARGADVVALVLGQTLRLTWIGATLGLLIAMVAGYGLRATLFGVSFVDPQSLVTSVLVLVGVALLAAAVPARRAAHVDPVAALRSE